jgi:hypothetical protein
LDLQQREEYHRGAVLWSPCKIREARVRETVNQREDEAEKLQKEHNRDLKATATLYIKKMAEERKARAAERVAARALKKRQRDAATTQKSRDTPKKVKRIVS